MRHPRFTACSLDRPGGVAFWVVVSLSLIIAILALGLDGGRMMEERRKAQAVADAAALAAAVHLYKNYNVDQGDDPDGLARAAAEKVATDNGYSVTGSPPQVKVQIPPTSGEFAGKKGYAEVTIEATISSSFGSMLTRQPLTVRSRAVARGKRASPGVLLLDPSGAGALTVTGTANLEVVGASIQVNSTSLLAFQVLGTATISALTHEIAGGYIVSAGSALTGSLQTNVQPTGDPLQDLPPPNLADYSLQSSTTMTINSDTTLNPGIYEGGINIRGGNVTLNPGIYVMAGGGFSVSSDPTITAQGVMLYNTSGDMAAGPISITGQPVINWTPPQTGLYSGISIFQDRSLSQSIKIAGGSDVSIQGTIYAPLAHLIVTGSSGLSGGSLGGTYITKSLSVSGTGTVRVNVGTNYPPIADIHLAE